MPIHTAFALRSPNRQQFSPLSYEIRGCAYRMHQRFGRLGEELVCQQYLANELKLHGFDVAKEFTILVEHRSFQKRYSVDLVVNRCGIVEAKTVAALKEEHEMQLMNYLLLLDVERGLLLNFRTQSVQAQFVHAPARLAKRKNFQIEKLNWTETSDLYQHAIGITRDWGTGLSLPLYSQALTHLMGGDLKVIRQVQIHRDGTPLGRQRFRLVNEHEAFQVTALKKGYREYESNLKKLLLHTSLDVIHWINIDLETVRFLSVERGG